MVRPLRVLVTGGKGQLGRDVAAVCAAAGDEVAAPGHAELDMSDRDAVLGAVTGWHPDLVVNCAAWTAVDACEGDPVRAFAANALSVRWLGEGARRSGAHVVHLSTDYVFDGSKAEPYHEWDAPGPRSVYGASKLAGERELLGAGTGATIVRTSWVSGEHGDNMVKTVLRLFEGDGPLRFVTDQRGCPTFTADLAPLVRLLGVSRIPGVVHATNQGAVSWFEFVRAVAVAAGADPSRVEPITSAELRPPRPAPRPSNSVLDNVVLRQSGIPLLPPFTESLTRLVGRLR